MKSLTIDSVVRTPDGQRGRIIDLVKKKEAEVLLFDDGEFPHTLAVYKIKKLTPVPPKLLFEPDLRSYYRFESGEDPFNDPQYFGITVKEKCVVTLEDTLAALRNMQSKKTTVKQLDQWYDHLEWDSSISAAIVRVSENEDEAALNTFTPDDSTITEAWIIYQIEQCWHDAQHAWWEGLLEDSDTEYIDYGQIFSDIDRFLNGQRLDIDPRLWSKPSRWAWALSTRLKGTEKLKVRELDLFRRSIDELCKIGNTRALEYRAYALYEGRFRIPRGSRRREN